MQTEVFTRTVTLNSVDCLVHIIRKDMPEKRLLLIWNVIVPHAGAIVPPVDVCNKWADECFGTSEQMDAISKAVARIKRTSVDNSVYVAKPGTVIETIVRDFEQVARDA